MTDPKLPEIEKAFRDYMSTIIKLHKEGNCELAKKLVKERNERILRSINELLPEDYKVKL